MANYDQRSPLDYRFGQLSGGVTALDTSLSSSAFATLPSNLSATLYVPLTLADDSLGLYETVWVTGHGAGSQSVTVVRGREGTTARAWAAGSTWRVAPTVRDALTLYTRGTLPTDAHLGMRCHLTDEGLTVVKTPNGWVPFEKPFGHLGSVDGFQLLAGAGIYTLFSAAQELRGGMVFENANDALVVPIAGLYEIKVKGYATGSSGYVANADASINSGALPIGTAAAGALASVYKFDANDYPSHGSVRRRLAAGDKLRLWQGASAGSTWGTTGYNGAFLEVLYVNP